MINKDELGKKLLLLRRRMNLSQSELARKLCITSKAVSKWECGISVPDIEVLLELSRLYGVSINELFETEE